MGRLIDAFKAFLQVLKGANLVSGQELDKLRQQLEASQNELTDLKSKPPPKDRFSEGAVYTLLLLQREGRLVDFLQEDLSGFGDDQIGAAVRQIHGDCAKLLREAFEVKPVLDKAEGEQVELGGDQFDPTTVKLSGNVPDNPPYKGALQHKGWQAGKVHLPERTGEVNPTIIQPAELEI